MSSEKIYLGSGARTLKLPSGDEGLYIDICIEHLKEILDNYEKEDVQRPWVSKKENKTYHNIRIFAIPKRETDENTLYPYYLEVAKVQYKK